MDELSIEKATPDAMLAELEKQGITDLEGLVKQSLSQMKGEGSSPSPEAVFYGRWYILVS